MTAVVAISISNAVICASKDDMLRDKKRKARNESGGLPTDRNQAEMLRMVILISRCVADVRSSVLRHRRD